MRIAIDVKTLSKRYTGIAIYVSEMIRFLNEIDSENDYYLCSNRDFTLNYPLNNNFHKIIYKTKLGGTIGMLVVLPKLLRDLKIDVFWGPEHCIPLGNQPFKRIVTIHDLSVLGNPKLGTRYNYLIQKFIAIPSIKSADTVIAISKATAKDVSKFTSPNRISVIYNGDSPYNYHLSDFTLDEIVDYTQKMRISSNNYFLFVGTIEPRKNIITIIKAFNNYKKETSSNSKLVLVGGLGWRYRRILRQIEESQYKNDIILPGFCSEKEKEFLYRNCICLLFPSIYEGFGFPILEAMSVGKPVITSSISSMPEVGSDIAYYIYDVFNEDELCSQMKRITLLTEKEKEKLSNKSIIWAKTFSRKNCAFQTLDIIKQLYKSKE